MNQMYLSLFVSFIGGGFVAAIINWIRTSRAERRKSVKSGFWRTRLEICTDPFTSLLHKMKSY